MGNKRLLPTLGLSKVGTCLRKGIKTFKAKMRQCKHHH